MRGTMTLTAQLTTVHGAVLPIGTRVAVESVNLLDTTPTITLLVLSIPVDDWIPDSDRHIATLAAAMTAVGKVAPPQVAGLTATAGALKATLGWTAGAAGVVYEVQHASDNVFTTPTTIRGVAGNALVVSGLTAAVARYFRVRAVAGSDIGAWSAVADCTPTA